MSNDHLYNTRWETIVTNRDSIDLVQIVTWNDYGESHYIGPIEGDQPNSQDWVDGFDHTPWLDMTTYYATAYKTGSYPDITEDKLYLWSRPHPGDADASSDPVGKPDSFQLLADVMWAVVFATSPCTVILATDPSSPQSFDVPAGVTKLSLAIAPGGTMYGKIVRDGNTVLELDPQFTFDPNPTTYNYNAMVTFASSNQTVTPPAGGTPNDNTSSSPGSSSTTVSSSSVGGGEQPSPTPPTTTPSSPSPSSSPPSGSEMNGGYRLKRHHHRRFSH
jgi:glucan endo-1,3-alpha-glucosidase